MKFSIGLVYYSGIEDIKKSISTLLSQSFIDFEILLRDQSINKEAFKYIEKTYSKEIIEKKIILFSGENLFHSGGHNFLVSEMGGENYVCASIDMEYEKNMLESLHIHIQSKQLFDCFTGKLLNYENKIDSAGIDKTWYFRFYDRGQGTKKNNFSENEEVFGATGALFCMRKKLIAELSKGIYKQGREQLFNEKLHYKNDVDLMCRMNILQKKTWYDADVYAIHKRTVSENSQKSDFAICSSVSGQKIIIKKYAHQLMKWWQIPFIWGAYFISSSRFLYITVLKQFRN